MTAKRKAGRGANQTGGNRDGNNIQHGYSTTARPNRQHLQHYKITADEAEQAAYFHLDNCQPGRPDFCHHFFEFCAWLDIEAALRIREAAL